MNPYDDDYDYNYPTVKERITETAVAVLAFAVIAASIAIMPRSWFGGYIVLLEIIESASSVLAGLWIVLLLIFVLRKDGS